VELLRDRLINADAALAHHSMNSKRMHQVVEGERKVYRDDKAAKAMRRRTRNAELAAIYKDPEALKDFQFARPATKVNRGISTEEDRVYIRRSIAVFDSRLVTTEGGLRVIGGFEPQEVVIPEKVPLAEFITTLPEVPQPLS